MPTAYKKMLFGHSAKFNGDAVYDHEAGQSLAIAAEINERSFLKNVSDNTSGGGIL